MKSPGSISSWLRVLHSRKLFGIPAPLLVTKLLYKEGGMDCRGDIRCLLTLKRYYNGQLRVFD